MAVKVLSTTDYSKFKFMEGNRPVQSRVNKLIAAIKRKNELSLYPIVCRQNGDGKLYIADGQHRFKSAQALKVPVFYIVSHDITLEDVIEANGIQKSWSLKDHVCSHAALGKSHYVTLKAFHEEYGLPISTCVAILSGTESGRSELVRSGRFAIKPGGVAYAQKTAEFIRSIESIFKGATDRGFVIAVNNLMHVDGFQPQRLMNKLRAQATKLVKCASWVQYVQLIEEIYNWHVSPKDLASLSIEVKRKIKS